MGVAALVDSLRKAILLTVDDVASPPTNISKTLRLEAVVVLTA